MFSSKFWIKSAPEYTDSDHSQPVSSNNPAGTNRPKKLWDLADKHHCPIIGTCLNIGEVVKFAERFKFKVDLRDEYHLHTETVGFSFSRNAVSEAIQRHLDKKYRTCLQRFAVIKSEAEVLALWKQFLASGEVAGALWAAYTHRYSSVLAQQVIFEDIHMLSHQVGAGKAAHARRQSVLETENAELKQAASVAQRKYNVELERLKKQIGVLNAQCAELLPFREMHAALQKRLDDMAASDAVGKLQETQASLREANAQLLAASQRAWTLDRALQDAQEEIQHIADERDQALNEREALERSFCARPPESKHCLRGDCETCEESRCILYVGGRTSMISHYRELAGRLNVRFIHHDGGLEESLSRLPDMIHGVDAVVCPTDAVSHSAYYQVKNHCKRIGKPLVFYKGSGLASFACVIEHVARAADVVQAE